MIIDDSRKLNISNNIVYQYLLSDLLISLLFETKENLKQFQEEAKKYEESEALKMAKQRMSFMGKLKVMY